MDKIPKTLFEDPILKKLVQNDFYIMHLSRLAFLSVIRNDPKSCLPALGVIMSIKDLLCQIEVWSS